MSKDPLAEQLLRESFCFLPADRRARSRLVREMFSAFDGFLAIAEADRLKHSLTVVRGLNLSGRPLEPDDGYLPPKDGNDRKHGLHARPDWEYQFAARRIEGHPFFRLGMERASQIHEAIREDYLRVFEQLDRHPALKGHDLQLHEAYRQDQTLSVVRGLLYFATTSREGEGEGVVGKKHQDRSFATRHLFQDSGRFEICLGDPHDPKADWTTVEVPKNHDLFFLAMKAALATGGRMVRPADDSQAFVVGGELKALWHQGVTERPNAKRRVVVSFVHEGHDVLC